MPVSRAQLALGVVLCALSASLARADSISATASPGAGEQGDVEAAAPSWLSHVVSTEGLRMRDTQDPHASEGDLRWAFDLDVADPRDRFELKASLGLWWTFDGQPGYGIPYGWAPIHSRPNSPFWMDVYQLAAELHGDGAVRLIRVGRQQADHGLPAIFDGAYLLVAPARRLRLYAFGGRAVFFYELVNSLFESWIASGGGEVLIHPDLRLDLDYRLVSDRPLSSFQDDKLGVTDHTYGATLRWRPSVRFMAQANVRGLNDRLAFTGGAVHLLDRAGDMGADANVELQLVTLDVLNELDDPYSLILGPSLRHGRASVDAWRSLVTRKGTFAAHLGVGGRFLLGEAETPFNRNFSRAYLLLAGNDLFTRGPFASVTAEVDAHGLSMDQGAFELDAAAGWQGRRLRVEAGTYYQRWEYIYYLTAQELADVRGTYVGARVVAWKWLSVQARYSYEVFDRRLHTVMVSLTQAY